MLSYFYTNDFMTIKYIFMMMILLKLDQLILWVCLWLGKFNEMLVHFMNFHFDDAILWQLLSKQLWGERVPFNTICGVMHIIRVFRAFCKWSQGRGFLCLSLSSPLAFFLFYPPLVPLATTLLNSLLLFPLICNGTQMSSVHERNIVYQTSLRQTRITTLHTILCHTIPRTLHYVVCFCLHSDLTIIILTKVFFEFNNIICFRCLTSIKIYF